MTYDRLSQTQKTLIDAHGGDFYITIPVKMVRLLNGHFGVAAMLSVLLRASKKFADSEGWFFMTVEDIAERTGMSSGTTQRKHRAKLRSMGLLEEKKEGIPCKTFYRLNLVAIADFLAEEETTQNTGHHIGDGQASDYHHIGDGTGQRTTDGTGQRTTDGLYRISLENKSENKSYRQEQDLFPELSPGIDYDLVMNQWNEIAKRHGLKTIRSLSSQRKSWIKKRYKLIMPLMQSIEQEISRSSFIKQGTFFSFSWLWKNDENYLKLIEGNYRDKKTADVSRNFSLKREPFR